MTLAGLLTPTAGPSVLRTHSVEPITETSWMRRPPREVPVLVLSGTGVEIAPIPRAFPHPDWHTRALCAGADARTFFGEEGGQRPSLRRSTLGRARVLCNACPVQRTCLRWALTTPELFGIWGGTSGRQREVMLRRIANGADVDELVTECLS